MRLVTDFSIVHLITSADFTITTTLMATLAEAVTGCLDAVPRAAENFSLTFGTNPFSGDREVNEGYLLPVLFDLLYVVRW